jgi:hypothetical protein
LTLSANDSSCVNERIARAAGRGGLGLSMNGLIQAGSVLLQVPP